LPHRRAGLLVSGATIGAALVFGALAGQHAASRAVLDPLRDVAVPPFAGSGGIQQGRDLLRDQPHQKYQHGGGKQHRRAIGKPPHGGIGIKIVTRPAAKLMPDNGAKIFNGEYSVATRKMISKKRAPSRNGGCDCGRCGGRS